MCKAQYSFTVQNSFAGIWRSLLQQTMCPFSYTLVYGECRLFLQHLKWLDWEYSLAVEKVLNLYLSLLGLYMLQKPFQYLLNSTFTTDNKFCKFTT